MAGYVIVSPTPYFAETDANGNYKIDDVPDGMSDADLIANISHGGPALNKSAEMPPWGYTLSKSDIAALVSYIRAVADPPYEAAGLVYTQK